MQKRNRTCCFTGHRDISAEEISAVTARTEDYIGKLVAAGVTYFGVGGALGYDTLAANLLFRLRNSEYPHIKVILVYPFDGFTSHWSKEQQEEYTRLLPQYDKVVRVCDAGCREAYLRRDRHLVDSSAYCICFCRRDYGGTAYTVRYAGNKGLRILNTADFDVGKV